MWSRFHTVTTPTTVSLDHWCANTFNKPSGKGYVYACLHSSPSGVGLLLQVHASIIEAWVGCHLLGNCSTGYKSEGEAFLLARAFSKMPYIAEFSERREVDRQL